ncbi:toxin [Lentzea sp. NBRC 105346]|uniref:DUF397 domain-containing protein n=1 Tax=Lentzea sp. NBRC 105346 TaxID=3032205 RepID=UPI0024A53734|nr:DUF397 domain-containing protein [Lentzea sp. NBRC 105346]GLZ29539.1 toxin [Lentzea sp. NBRC 105346]
MSEWHKSSYSPNASDCVEVRWRKSSYSPTASDCVEVGHGVGIRDSKSPAAHLALDAPAWTAFLAAAKSGGFAGR